MIHTTVIKKVEMHFIPLYILLVFPLVTEESCIFVENEFSCKGTTYKDFLQEFYKDAHQNLNSVEYLSVNIEDSHFQLIEYFPNLPNVGCNFTTTKLTIKNSSVEYVGQLALKESYYLDLLDLSWNKLSDLSFVAGLPERIAYLFLNHNNISHLDDVFQTLRRLTSLDLSYNRLTIIDFNYVYRVHTLNFSHNNINMLIPSGHVHSFFRTDLSYNEITKFDEKILRNKFESLDLSYNKLTRVVLDTNDKEYLNLSNNNITKLLTAPWVSISELDLSSIGTQFTFENMKLKVKDRLLLNNNKIPMLDTTTVNITYRYKQRWDGDNPSIDLSNSSIEDISQDYFSFFKVPSLNLSWNNIKRLRSNTFSSAIIDILDVSFSNVHVIENDAFKKLSSNRIILRGNSLKDAKHVFNGVEVSEIDLSSNYFNIIRERSFMNCYGLQILNLSSCSIDKIENRAFFGLPQLNLLDLTYNKLHVLESNTFRDLSVANIKFHGNRIYTVQKRAFTDLPNLIELNLSHLGLNNLEPGAFQNLSNTEIVDLSNNDIAIIPLNLFTNMDRVRTVYLEGNRISTLNPFSNRLNLQGFTLSFNGVFGPYETIDLHIRYLYLKNSKIDRLRSNSFAGLYNLIELRFDSTYVGFVEAGALNSLFNLEYLDSQNLFRVAKVIRQNTFRDLKALVSLNLSHISLESIEARCFVGLRQLQTLLLNNNDLSQLVENSFDGLTSLKTLDLSHNKISICDDRAFESLENLEILHLEFNNLLAIGSQVLLGHLGKLLELHLEYNNISTLHINSFFGLKNLEKLYLQNNSIKDFPVGVFQYLPTLNFLNFSRNKLQTLKTGALSNLRNLKELDFSDNGLHSLEYVDIFFSLKNLEVVKLDGNRLKQFDFKRLLLNLTKLKYMGISFNKWKCETLSQIIEILNNKNVSYTPRTAVYDNDNVDGVGCVDICKLVYCPQEGVTRTFDYY